MGATIKDISKMTGLGYATISAYLNGVKVRPQNKEAIEYAIKELGYVRNEYARGLKTRKSMTVGAITVDLNNMFSMAIISTMEEELRKHGYGLIICDCKYDPEREKDLIKFMQSKMVDGLVVMSSSDNAEAFNALLANNTPVIAFDRKLNNPKIPTVTVDNLQSSYNAIKLCIAKGHRNIAIIGNLNNSYTATDRHKGYQKAMEEIDCYNENYVYDGGMKSLGAFNAMEDILLHHPEITAVFVVNYEMVLGAISACNTHHKRIGEDISIIGYDMEFANYIITPTISSVNQPLNEIGINICDMLIKAMNKEQVEDRELLTSIQYGDSVKDIRF